MIDILYKVIFEGDLFSGQNQVEVQRKLAELFGSDVKTAGKLFSGTQHKVKSNLDLKQAKKYVRALAKLGALAYIVQEIVESGHPIKQQKGTFTETGSFDITAVRAFFDQQEAKKAEDGGSTPHEIFSFDAFDDEVASMEEDEVELSGVQNVMTAAQIAKMLDEDK